VGNTQLQGFQVPTRGPTFGQLYSLYSNPLCFGQDRENHPLTLSGSSRLEKSYCE
jgi:hypothetical protein